MHHYQKKVEKSFKSLEVNFQEYQQNDNVNLLDEIEQSQSQSIEVSKEIRNVREILERKINEISI